MESKKSKEEKGQPSCIYIRAFLWIKDLWTNIWHVDCKVNAKNVKTQSNLMRFFSRFVTCFFDLFLLSGQYVTQASLEVSNQLEICINPSERHLWNKSIQRHALTHKNVKQLSPLQHLYMGVSKNKGTPKWMVYNGKPYYNGWFGGTTIFGNTHIDNLAIHIGTIIPM